MSLLWKKLFFQFQRISLNTSVNSITGVLKSSKMPYYAVARGRTAGIYMSWEDCESQVKGFSGARFKKFDSLSSAENFILTEGGGGAAPKTTSKYSGSSNNNLKRSHSSVSASYNQINSYDYERSSSRETAGQSDSEDSLSDDSDDFEIIITKQLDNIEKRVKSFEKGIDKIVKKNTSKAIKSSGKKAIMIEPPQPKKRKSTSAGFDMDSSGYVQVYTDGACSSNGRQGARAGYGVYWGDSHHLNTSEPVSGRATNNCGEIQAATHAIKQALQNGVTKLAINTDSQFLINSVTKWMPGWKRKGWKLQSGEPVKNEADFKELDALQHQLQVKWNYVEAHRGIHGNEMADQLAKAGASMYKK